MSEDVRKEIEDGLAAGKDTGVFGTHTKFEEASLVLYPVRWEATTSYGGGTSEGPDLILEASRQLDLEDACFDRPYQSGIFMVPGREEISSMNEKASLLVDNVRKAHEEGSQAVEAELRAVNEMSERVNQLVYKDLQELLSGGKLLGLVGGDHSCPYGFIKLLSEQYSEFGILHFDAHLDLRESSEGFQFSHASIMNNVLKDCPSVTRLVSIGIRDYSFQEKELARKSENRVRVYSDRECFRRKQRGELFSGITRESLSVLPEKVYVSFDIDGLDPRLCPSTGTPVPGGLDFHEACYLLEELALNGKKIIGFDLTEVARSHGDSEWDGNVGARILYKLCGALLYSQGKIGLAEGF